MAAPATFNVIAIGAGAAGLVTTAATAGLGGRAALIERGRMGGDCLNYGCVPSKALIASARLAQRMREAEGFVKVIAGRRRGEILGATIVGEDAGELIHELALAMQHRIPLGKIASVIHAYPTRAEAVRRAADAFNRTRFTAGRKKFLAGLFRHNLPFRPAPIPRGSPP